MSSTDQAFIRVFDSHAQPQAPAPHVSFAARGVQLAAGFEPVIVCGGDAAAVTPESAAESAPTATARAPAVTSKAPPSPKAPAERGRPATYLPSSYRHLVEVEGPTPPPSRKRLPHDQQALQENTPEEKTPQENTPHHRTVAPNPHPDPPPRQELQPALEVDALHWPRVVTRLLEECPAPLRTLVDALEGARLRGDGVIVFHSATRGAGCTTIMLAMARLLAERGRSVAVVDAEFTRPHLARAVGLSLEQGWEATILVETPLAEFIIRSLEDDVSIVPLAAPLGREQLVEPLVDRAKDSLRLLAAYYDLVLLDGGFPDWCGDPTGARALATLFATVAHGCVVVTPAGTPSRDHYAPSPLDLGLPIVGVVENSAEGDP